MSKTPQEIALDQENYYTRLNDILIKVQTKQLKQYEAESAIRSLNNDFDSHVTKASECIVEAMLDEYANFDENSSC